MNSNLALIQQYTTDLSSAEKLQFQTQFTTRQRNVGMGVALALLTGGLGIHKFYLKNNGSGIIYALCGTVGWFLIVPPIIVGILCIVDACNMQGEVVKFNNALAREVRTEIEILR